ncbi:MAG: hypothetical protein J5J00_11320 [Deltaproteobacteria bacterium]|nr:hypothetical protein [Deltaproteobacteria bacterium]
MYGSFKSLGSLASAAVEAVAVILILSFLLSFSLPVLPAAAEGQSPLFHKSCSDFKSPREFVKHASIFCLKQQNTKSCQRGAQQYFKSCKYDGDFKRISRDVHGDLLLMIVFSKTPRLGQIMDGQS